MKNRPFSKGTPFDIGGEEIEVIDRSFFEKDAETVAKNLLGKLLCRKLPNRKILKMTVIETEAYPADDSACYGYGYKGNHGNKKKTKANAPLFETGGTCCIYGGMILIVCAKKGKPDNVLIRSAVNEDGFYNGPCKIARALKINKAFHGTDTVRQNCELWIEENNDNDYVAVKRKGLSGAIKDKDKNSKRRFLAV